VPLTDIESDGQVPMKLSIVPFMVIVGGGVGVGIGVGVGGGVGVTGGAGGGVTGVASLTLVANTVPSLRFVPTTPAVSPLTRSAQLFALNAVAPLV